MKGPEINLEDIVSLLDLDRKGIKAVVKDDLRVMRTKPTGHYASFSYSCHRQMGFWQNRSDTIVTTDFIHYGISLRYD